MADFLEVHKEYFINLLSLKNGIPSHDTFSRVFSLIDAKSFLNIWIKEILNKNGQHLCIDRKQ